MWSSDAKVNQTGAYGVLLGKQTEDRFFAICDRLQQEGKLPVYLLSVSKTERVVDQKGIDAFLETDKGTMPLQIKRSRRGKEHHHRYAKKNNLPYIPCLIVSPTFTDEKILANLERIVCAWRESQNKV